MTSYEKAWTTITGITTQDTSSDITTHARSTLWTFKEKIKSNTTFIGNWTVAGSGTTGFGSGAMDGYDRWISYTDLSATNNWICLKSPSNIGPVYLTMIQRGSGVFEYILSKNLPTGGSTESPPSQSGNYFSTGNQTWTVNGTKTYAITMGVTLDGGFYCFETDGVTNQPVNIFGVLQLNGTLTADTVDLLILFKGMTSTSMNTTHTADTIWMINSASVSAKGSPMLPYYYNAQIFSATGIAQNTFFSSTQYLNYPFFVYINEASKISFRGRVFDIYIAPDLVTNNSPEVVGASTSTHRKFGAFWFPIHTSITL